MCMHVVPKYSIAIKFRVINKELNVHLYINIITYVQKRSDSGCKNRA